MMRYLNKGERKFLHKILEKSRLHQREIAGTFKDWAEYEEDRCHCDMNNPIVFHTHPTNNLYPFSPQDICSCLNSPVKTDILVYCGGIDVIVKEREYNLGPDACYHLQEVYLRILESPKEMRAQWYAFLQLHFDIEISHYSLKDTHILIEDGKERN